MPDNDGIQMSFRLPAEIHFPCKELAEKNGQTLAEWIRRAMKEKLERDTGAREEFTREQLKEIAREEALKIISEMSTNISSKGIGNRQNVRIGGR